MPVALEQPQVDYSPHTLRLRRTRRVVAIAIRLTILAAVVAIFCGGYYLARRGFGREWRYRVVEELHKRGVEAQIGRLTLLEALYTRRRMEPTAPSLMTSDLETLIGRPREHLEFTIWYLAQKKYVTRDDQARLQITADGVDHLEHHQAGAVRRRLQAVR